MVLVLHMRRFRLRRGLLLPFPFPGLLCHSLFLWNDGISISIFYQRWHHFGYVRQYGLNFNRLNYAVSREGTESSGSFLWWCLPSKITLRRVFFIYLFIYIYFWLCWVFVSVPGLSPFCGEQGPLFIAARRPLTVAASPAAEHRLQTRRLSSCGSRAQSLRGMWDLPRPGLEPVSPALAGRFLTTAPPGKPLEGFWKGKVTCPK